MDLHCTWYFASKVDPSQAPSSQQGEEFRRRSIMMDVVSTYFSHSVASDNNPCSENLRDDSDREDINFRMGIV